MRQGAILATFYFSKEAEWPGCNAAARLGACHKSEHTAWHLQVVEAKEYIARPAGLGLGATPQLAPRSDKHVLRPGETREPRKDMVYYAENGQQKHVKGLDDKLVERDRPGPRVGKTMRIVAGPHSGLLCTVLAIEPQVGQVACWQIMHTYKGQNAELC